MPWMHDGELARNLEDCLRVVTTTPLYNPGFEPDQSSFSKQLLEDGSWLCARRCRHRCQQATREDGGDPQPTEQIRKLME
jgi:hypothetical protein